MFFVRFVNSKEQAEKDLERGYSFVDYTLFDTPEDVLDFFGIEYENLEDAIEKYGLAQDNGAAAGLWGIALNGLCGFGDLEGFETVEEARAYAIENHGYNGVSWPAAAIFTGSMTSDSRVFDGDCFIPKTIVEVIDL